MTLSWFFEKAFLLREKRRCFGAQNPSNVILFYSLSIFQLGERMVVLKPCCFFMVTSRFWRTLEVNNFVSVDFETQVSIWLLISMKFCSRIINKKEGTKVKSARALYICETVQNLENQCLPLAFPWYENSLIPWFGDCMYFYFT